MRVLGIETTGDFCGVAVVDDAGVAGEIGFRHRMDLSRRLLPAVDTLLSLLRLRPGVLQGVAVSLGPGSFTGLRIGVATAKTFAWSLGLPVAGVSTLAALAAACRLPLGTHVCPLIGAGGDQLYAALYRQQEAGPTPVRPPALLTPAELAAALAEEPGPLWFVGTTSPFRGVLAERLGERARFAVETHSEPPARIVARLGWRRLRAGDGDAVAALAPLYLRPSAAEARREQWLTSQP
jgi:tRNA threonylcarbamoyladenosine biosynthesis protein TsaB